MRVLREKMKEAVKKDNRGLSLVEILCAIAIFSLIAAAIGAVVVLSARTFNKGVTETNLQQEAQVAANRIGTIIQDACEASFDADAKILTLKTNEMIGEGDARTNRTYTISLDNDKKELLYSDDTMTGAKLAENIEYFHVGTDDFDKSNTVYLNMRVKNGEKVYNVQYAISARNQMTADIDDMEAKKYRSILCDSYVIMTPGETYAIPFTVSGEKPRIGMEASFHNDFSDAFDIALDSASVTIPTNASGTINLYIRTKDTDPRAEACIPIRVRRVTNVAVTYTRNTSGVDKNSSGNSYEAAGCVYTFYARVNVDYSERQIGAHYDDNYKNPRAVEWKVTTDGAPINMSEYFDIQQIDDKNIPSVKVTIKKDLPSGLRVTALATSKHAKGVNKGGVSYYNDANNPPAGYDSVTKADGTKNDIEKGSSEHWGYNSFEARPTKINMQKEITLEPNQEGYVPFDMKGGLSNVTFDYIDRSDSRTEARYDAAQDKVFIKLGPDEKGTGKTPDSGKKKYTFTINVKVGTTQTYTIIVHVRRMENMSIKRFDNFYDDNKNLMKNPTYDFRARINVDNNETDQDAVRYLYIDLDGEKEDGTKDEKVSSNVNKTLASKITWWIKEDGNELHRDSVICMAGTSATDKGTVIGDYTKVFKVAGKTYYTVVNVKPARVEQDASGNWYLKQLPEIDIKPGNGTVLPENTELTVRMEMLHPLGGDYSATQIKYSDDVWAEASVRGKQSVDVPELVIAEPGQGTNDSEQSDYEMVIPIEVAGGAVHKMSATISGNSSKDTKLSDYSASGKDNPFLGVNAGSNTNAIWYLGLVIGKDEKGKKEGDNYTGLIDLTVTAYDSDDGKIATITSKIAIRRVNEIDLVVKNDENQGTDISELNSQGSVVCLEAYPKGFGGTEYFDIQKKDGKICRWETGQNGKILYKSPAPIKWTMEYNKTEMTLDKWTDYFKTVNKPVTDDQNYHSSITFVLNKPLPSGAIIRATSLHAKGDDGGTKYNKAGEKYDDVCGEIKIGNGSLIVVSGGWKRGGTVDISYNIPEKNLVTEYNSDGSIKSQYLVDDNGNYWGMNDIANKFQFKTKYEQNSHAEIFYQSRGLADGYRPNSPLYMWGEPNVLTDYKATLIADSNDQVKIYSFSSPYPNASLGNLWIDINKIYMKVNVGGGSWVDAPDTIAVGEEWFDVDDVVFQYQNALPDTSKKKGDSDGAWTSKNNNVLKVYVTSDDTIESYKSYYKLSEGWEETYERYSVIPERYVGVIHDDPDDTKDERMTAFSVSDTVGEGDNLGRSYVSFKFTDANVVKNYCDVGKVVKMIYEYNPFLCNTGGWQYGCYDKTKLDDVDGCEGILEFHFVQPNINFKSGVTMPEVRYCPTYADNKSSATPNYYYISDKSRFYINSNGTTANYQTGGVGNWTTQYTMTYANGSWTINN